MPGADILTIDVFHHPLRRVVDRRRAARAALARPIAGLRAATVNHANDGTHAIVPKPVGTCLVMAWDSAAAAREAWRTTLGPALGRADYRLDGEVVRARFEHEHDTWHGWRPSAEGASPLGRDEPLVAIVHGVLHRRGAPTFFADNVHAASRARHHPGHRGSVDVFRTGPIENTSISLWSTVEQAQDFAYRPGGHRHAMTRSRELTTHRTGVFLRVRPLASSGGLGRDAPSYPDLPAAVR